MLCCDSMILSSKLTKINLPRDVDSILEAVLTVSPNKQYRGIVSPTTPENKGSIIVLKG